MTGERFQGNLAASFFCLAAVVLNHSIFRLGAMPLAWAILLIVAIAALAIVAPNIRLRAGPAGPLTRSGMLIGALALTPILASVVLGWNREFSFGGDQSFHLKQAIYMAFWWLSPVGSTPVGILGRALDVDAVRAVLTHPGELLRSRALLFALSLGVIVLCYRRNRLAALIVATVIFVGWGLYERAIYLRYPGAWYMFAIPFLGPAFVAGNLELAGRLTSVTSAVAWLFVLRPFVLGRWPDVRVLPLVAALLWHQALIYYFDSAYLEPWMVVFLLVAIEALIARGREGAPAACLLIGLAATTKEPAILALPFVWLAGMPWQVPWRERLSLVGAGFAAGIPFVLYYAARQSVDIQDLVNNRFFEFGMTAPEMLAYAREFFFKMSVAFAGGGLVVAAFALLAVPLIFIWRPAVRLPLALMFGFGVALCVFFSFDRGAFEVPGEFRFFLSSLPFVAVGVVAFDHVVQPRTALIVGLLLLTLQVPGAVLAVSRSAALTPRSFTEFYDTPMVFPLKSLVSEARAKGWLPSDVTIRANMLHEGVRVVPGIPIAFGSLGELYCECSKEHPATLALFVRYVNYSAPFAEHPPGKDEVLPPLYRNRDLMWREHRANRPMCIAKLRATCGHVLERVEGGEMTAVLGLP
jgi:hypothetical protein